MQYKPSPANFQEHLQRGGAIYLQSTNQCLDIGEDIMFGRLRALQANGVLNLNNNLNILILGIKIGSWAEMRYSNKDPMISMAPVRPIDSMQNMLVLLVSVIVILL
jgi:hypothetical protein